MRMISVIIPVYNEQGSIKKIYYKIIKAFKKLPSTWKKEVIFVDDGSIDNTFAELKKLPLVLAVRHFKNQGQTAATLSGLNKSRGDVIITLDGDLQNNPEEIPLLFDKLNEGYDMVVGWRVKRHDSFSRNLLSSLAYFWRKLLLGSPIRDSGCNFKIMKRIGLEGSLPKGQIHRFLPEIFLAKRFKVTEAPISHFPRFEGKSKYGLERIIRGFADSWLIFFWQRSNQRLFSRK